VKACYGAAVGRQRQIPSTKRKFRTKVTLFTTNLTFSHSHFLDNPDDSITNRMGDRGIGVPFLQWQTIFFPSEAPELAAVPTDPLIQHVMLALQSNTEFKHGLSYPFPLPYNSWRFQYDLWSSCYATLPKFSLKCFLNLSELKVLSLRLICRKVSQWIYIY
jgi:hypothetical protein